LISLDRLPEKHGFSANRAAAPQESPTMSNLKIPTFFTAEKNVKKNTRNRSVALVSATVLLHNFTKIMRRDIFQAIADPTRRAIIALIALQAMTPNALAEHFDTSRQAVSKHLRILTECELVTQEQKGREIYYRLEIEKMKEIDEWLEQYRKIWETRYSQLDDLLAAIKKQKEEK
jgi:DNA-binding transcriptional ArsR family regulator